MTYRYEEDKLREKKIDLAFNNFLMNFKNVLLEQESFKVNTRLYFSISSTKHILLHKFS